MFIKPLVFGAPESLLSASAKLDSLSPWMRGMSEPSAKDLSRTEAELFARLTAARESYEKAKAEAAILTGLRKELGLDHPDGRAAAHKAIQIENAALRAYSEALRDFNGFICKNLGSNRLPQK
jgi:hypothetical protein